MAFCLQNSYRFQSTWIHFLRLNEVRRWQCQNHPQQEIRGLTINMVRKNSKHHEVPSVNMCRMGVGIPKNFCKWFHSFRTLCICPPQWQYHFDAQCDHSKQQSVFVSRADSCKSRVFIKISLKTIQGRTVMGRCICRSFSLTLHRWLSQTNRCYVTNWQRSNKAGNVRIT
jgi:hypothetical protein